MRVRAISRAHFPVGLADYRTDSALSRRMDKYLDHHLRAANIIKEARDRALISGRQPISELDKVHLREHASDFTNIYFILCSATGAIKIGRTDDVQKRIAALQIASPGELRLLCSFRGHLTLENFLHSFFSAQKVRGEWFRPDDSLLDLIEAGLDGGYLAVLGLCKQVIGESKAA